MEAFKFLILEDDISFFLDIKMILEDLGYFDIFHFDNAETALKFLENREINLMILDINLKGEMTGVDFSKRVARDVPFVFISSNDSEDFPEIKEMNQCLGYLNKPITKTSLKTSLDLAIRNLNRVVANTTAFNNSIFLKKKEVYKKVLVNDISHIEATEGYSQVYVNDEIFITNLGLNEFEELLDQKMFVRVHRGHIINFDKIEGLNITENTLFVHGNAIPVSRNNKKMVFDRLDRIS